MMRTNRFLAHLDGRLAARLSGAAAIAVAMWSCKENLPTGPSTFSVALSVVNWADTLVVGDARAAGAKATDAAGREIQGLPYGWVLSDTTVARLDAGDTSSGRSRTVTALHTGLSKATVSLADPRFVVSAITKNLLVVVGGISVTSAHDTTLTAINDTAKAIAQSLVKSGANLVAKTGQGVRWFHGGVGAVTMFGTGDTIRYIAKLAGVDTLFVVHDFCLRGARCADTVVVRVSQVLKMSLSAKTFPAWSLGDSVGPTVTLADRRGTGLQFSSVRFVPLLSADSVKVTVTSNIGYGNPETGLVAAPKLVATANGTAKVLVVAKNPDGSTADTDTLTVTVRQVATRVTVEPRASQLTENDSIPAKVTARDARGGTIADAVTPTTASSGVTYTGGLITGVTTGTAFTGTVFATVTGVAAAANNAGAPATPLVVDTANVRVLPAITFTAGAAAAQQSISQTVLNATGQLATNKWVRFKATAGVLTADSVLTDALGNVSVTWTPPTAAGSYRLTGILSSSVAPTTVADSAGLVVVRRRLVVTAGAATAATSTVAIRTTIFVAGDTATVSVLVKDAFGNLVASTVPASIVLGATGGTLGAVTCSGGICQALFTATTVTAPGITCTLGGTDVVGSPLALTVTPGTAVALVIATQPVGHAVNHNVALATQPLVWVVDAYGNLVSTNTAIVTATATVLTGTPTMATTAVTTVNGVATFASLPLTFGGGAGSGTIRITFTGFDGAITLTLVVSAVVTNPA